MATPISESDDAGRTNGKYFAGVQCNAGDLERTVKSALVTRWEGWAGFALGLWLAMSPWFCGYADQHVATGNAAFMGISLALASHFEASLDACSAEWLNLAAGMWLVAAPFVLEFGASAVPAINSIAVGTLVVVLAASALSLGKEIEKWWHRQFIKN
jgi:SPW repeat